MLWSILTSCHPGDLGQFSSPLASPNDPIFWPIHVGFERYWSFARLAPSIRDAFNNTWDDYSHDREHTCRGWNMTSKLPFKAFGNGPAVTAAAHDGEGGGDDGDESEHAYNSVDLIEFFEPLNPTLPHIW